jgi:hypothetical protein
MSFHSWLRNLRSAIERAHQLPRSRPAVPLRQRLESLGERIAPAFLAPVEYSTGAWPGPMVAADFNNDTVLDLAAANTDDSTVSVLLGNGDGTFRPAVGPAPATGAYTWSIAVGDFDRDGNLDLATAGDQDVRVLMGDGTGQFGAPTSIPLTGFSPSVAVGDFTGDGLMDLGVVTNEYPGVYIAFASIHAGDGAGHFANPRTVFIGTGQFTAATTVDLDGDGADDLATANSYSYLVGAVGLLRGDASGYFRPPTLIFTGASANDVAMGDVSGDGVADVVTADGFYSEGVSVLLGDGLGGYGAAQTYATGTWPSDVELGDFNGDGRIDIAYSSSTGVNLLQGDGSGGFSGPLRFPAGESTWAVAAEDFNRDGWLDVAVTNISANTVSVLINDQTWAPVLPAISIGDATVLEGSAGTVSATFTLTLTHASAAEVTVQYATANGTATGGSDYQVASDTLTLLPGETSKTITMLVSGDRLHEPIETFFVNLNNNNLLTNATIADGQGIGTIIDDEPRISISDVVTKEGRKGKTTLFIFTVSLAIAYDQPVTVSYQTVNGTATTNDGDYFAKTGTLTFAPGETTKTITIVVNGDNKREANETFYLDLFGNSGNLLLTDGRGVGTIVNDD